MTRPLAIAWFAAMLPLWSALYAAAQEAPPPKPEDQPRFVLNTGGPVNAVRALAFSPDSTRLYAAGMDKVVLAWELRETGTRILRRDAHLVQTLRWEITRGLRGAIYSLASSPVERRVAIGGYSARGTAGDIAMYDTASANVERALLGHQQSVASLGFSPDGARLASVSVDGGLRLWSAPEWQSQELRGPEARHDAYQPLIFLTDRILALASHGDQDGATWHVALFDSERPEARPTVLGQAHAVGVAALARGKMGRWASADRAGNVYIWEGSSEPRARLLRAGRIAESLAFGPAETLFVATRLQDVEGQVAVLEMWDSSTLKPLDVTTTAQTQRNFACAVSPDDRWVATCGGDESDVLVYPLFGQEGKRLDKPLSRGQRLVLQGRGESVRKVAFADASHVIGFGPATVRESFNEYGQIERAFDLGEPNLLDRLPDGVEWRTPSATAQGWKVVAHDAPYAERLELLNNGRSQCVITLDPERQGRARSYCWIPDQSGANAAIAVGTDLQHGVFVYRLALQGECPLLRYYRDHTEWVASLSVSADGRYLASGSADQTIKVWSLEGLLPGKSPFRAAGAWGATFEERGREVVVSNVLEVGIAARRGLQQGDIVRKVVREDGTVVERKSFVKELERMPLWQQVRLVVERAGRDLPDILVVPAWEPLATLFVDRLGEWAFSTPQGPYDASVQGDQLFGWQINRGVDATPEFYQAEQFRDELEQPKTLRRLLEAGSLPAAMRLAGSPAPPNLNAFINRLALRTPQVTIVTPGDGQKFEGTDAARMVAHIEYPSSNSSDRFNVQVFINGAPLDPATAKFVLKDRQQTVEIPMLAADPSNKITVVVTEKAGGVVGRRDVSFRSNGIAARKRLFILAMAASEYQPPLALKLPVSDCQATVARLKQGAAELYEVVEPVRELYNQDAARPQVLEAVSQLRGELAAADPRDLLVVLVYGHGTAIDGEYYFVPPATGLPDPKVVKEVGIPWRELAGLGDLPCRKMIVLDTCFSGNAALASRPLDHHKAMVRPLERQEILVLSSAGVGQFATEGVFTRCLLDGFDGQADRHQDGEVDLEDVFQFVVNEVPRRTRGDALQQPKVSPLELESLWPFVPLVRYQRGE